MRAFDLNFTRAARIFDPNFMRGGRKPAHPRDKILNGERLLRGDRILSGSGILSDNKILKGCEILKGVGILNDREILRGAEVLNRMSRGGIQRGFSRWVLRELCGEASSLCPLRKFQSASSSQADHKFKRATALQTDRKFKIAVSLRVAYKFKTPMQEFHRGSCAASELLRQKSRSEVVPRNCLKFQSPLYVLARLKFVGAMSEMGTSSPSVPLKFQISVAALSQLKFRGVPNAITRLKFQSAMVAEFARSKFGSPSRAARRCKIRAQGQGG
jgi:hypothetical protein